VDPGRVGVEGVDPVEVPLPGGGEEGTVHGWERESQACVVLGGKWVADPEPVHTFPQRMFSSGRRVRK